LLGSGGMPSSHTAFVIGLTTAIAVRHGTGSPLFAVCAVISLIVMYDASGVRLHAGKQASALNLIISEFPADHPVQETGRLREALGHTHAQVTMGALVGIVIGFISEVAMGTG
jgi:acid phosphatase family membrane protein YuiD